jgi:hypothetical protein
MLQWWADYVDSIVKEAKCIRRQLQGCRMKFTLAILPVISTSKGFLLRRILFPELHGYFPARAPDLTCSDRLSDGRVSTQPPDLSWHPPVTVRTLRLSA